jgi:hypothetical protein
MFSSSYQASAQAFVQDFWLISVYIYILVVFTGVSKDILDLLLRIYALTLKMVTIVSVCPIAAHYYIMLY